MVEEKLIGYCDSCEKAFRVPSADRTYKCKACGGTVSVPDDDEDEYDEDDEYEEDEEDEEPDEEDDGDEFEHGGTDEHPMHTHRASDRIRAQRKSKKPLIIGLIVAVVVLGGGGTSWWIWGRPAPVVVIQEIDLDKVLASFVEKWEAGDIPGLAAFRHPESRDDFRAMLERMAADRGWEGGFPAASNLVSQVIDGTREQPKQGSTTWKYGEGESALAYWQYSISAGAWLIYKFEYTPPPLAPVLERWRTAWATSDPQALRPFFSPFGAADMAALVAQGAEEGNWTGAFPALEEPVIEGEEEYRAIVGPGKRPIVEATFPTADGGLHVRWKHEQDRYQWFATGFVFP